MSISPRLRIVAAEPPELVVYDEPGACSYLPDRTWRLPLRLPVRMLTRDEFGRRLAEGDRRQGRLLYRTACPHCSACEPIRLEAKRYELSRTQRRVVKRGDRYLRIEIGPVEVSDERVALYNLHKHGRQLSSGEAFTEPDAYRSFLGESCCESFEMRYFAGNALVGIAIVDRAHDALSAVYFYWDPRFSWLSPGTYSILKQLELCRRLDLDYLYLGLYIENCPAMAYKGRFLPHQRMVGGRWRRYDRDGSDAARPCPAPGD